MRLIVVLLALTDPAAAQDGWRLDPVVMDQCTATGLAEGCIGMAARACVLAEGAMARGLCLGAETAYWQDRATSAQTALAAREAEVQALSQRRGVDPVPSLAAIETGFATYLDAACAWREGQWDGIHAGWEWAECRLHLTAHHARMLETMVEVVE